MTIDHPLSRLIAAVMGLSSFALAVLAGMVAGNPGVVTLLRALVCMAAGFAVGHVLGWAAAVAASEYLKSYREARPIADPLVPVAAEAADGEADA